MEINIDELVSDSAILKYKTALENAYGDLKFTQSKIVGASNNNAVAVAVMEDACVSFVTKHIDVLLSMMEGQILTANKDLNITTN